MRSYFNTIIAVVFALSVIAGTHFQIQNYSDAQGLDGEENYGWVAPEPGHELFGQDNVDVPSGQGQVRLLYEDWQTATGYGYVSRRQIGFDCVGQGTAVAADLRMAVQAVEGVYKIPEYTVSAPPIYALSRIEIAGKSSAAPGGSQVRWAMKALEQYGVLFEKDYMYAGYDLSTYDPNKSRTWGSQGLPSVLEDVAKLTPMVSYYKVRNYEEVRDAINAGYPVVVGSNVGFSRRTIFSRGNVKATRDQDGFLRANGIWNHAMCLIGVDDRSARKGACCQNSSGISWVSGPTKLNNPPGSFWIDKRTITRMASQGDAFAIAHINSPLSYRLKR